MLEMACPQNGCGSMLSFDEEWGEILKPGLCLHPSLAEYFFVAAVAASSVPAGVC
jgi:hypothetical protein